MMIGTLLSVVDKNTGALFYNGYTFTGHLSFLNDTYNTLPQILWVMLGFVGGAGAVYAIILGINLAKSESDDKRKSASTRLKNTLIGLFTLLLLIVFLNVLLPLILRGIWPNNVMTIQEFTGDSNAVITPKG